MKPLNFNTLKKKTMTVILPDENKTTLLLKGPTKELVDEFTSIQNFMDEDSANVEAISELYAICAKILSRNKNGIEITQAEVSSMFDFEDILLLLKSYTEFIREITNSKN